MVNIPKLVWAENEQYWWMPIWNAHTQSNTRSGHYGLVITTEEKNSAHLIKDIWKRGYNGLKNKIVFSRFKISVSGGNSFT